MPDQRTVAFLICLKSPDAVAGCQSALLKLASHAVLSPILHGSPVGCAVLAASPTSDVKLKILCRPCNLLMCLREWHLNVGRISPGLATSHQMCAGVRHLIGAMSTDQKTQMHVVLLTDQVPSPTPQLARLSQDAMRTGASVCFTVLDSATPAHDVASVEDHHAHFAAAIAPLEQLSLHVVQNGRLLDEQLAQEWWQMLQGGCHLTTQALHGGLTPAGLSLQLPSQSGKDIMLACSVRAQIRPWSPALRCVAAGSSSKEPAKPGAPSLLQLGNHLYLNISTAGSMYGLTEGASAGTLLKALQVVKACDLDQTLLHGWPHVLQPALHKEDGQLGGMFSALVQALAANEQVLLAHSQADIGDSLIRPAVCTQYYALIPGSDSMSLLLRRVGGREQLVSEASASPPPIPADEHRSAITHALECLQDTTGAAFSPLQLTSDVHSRIAELVLSASNVCCVD